MSKKIFLFLCVLIWAKASFAFSLKQHMAVNIGIFDAAEIDLFYTFDKDSFDIKADVATTHTFDMLYPFYASYEANGKNINGQIVPKNYAAHSKTRKHVRQKQIFYNDKGVAYKRISTKDKRKKETKITNVPKTANAADLQSVFAAFILFYQKNESCEMVREIFDGKKHYRIEGHDTAKEMKYVNFMMKEIPVQSCQIFIKNLKDNDDALLDASADRAINVWFGSDEKTKMPFLAEIGIDSTPLGALKVTPLSLKIQ